MAPRSLAGWRSSSRSARARCACGETRPIPGTLDRAFYTRLRRRGSAPPAWRRPRASKTWQEVGRLVLLGLVPVRPIQREVDPHPHAGRSRQAEGGLVRRRRRLGGRGQPTGRDDGHHLQPRSARRQRTPPLLVEEERPRARQRRSRPEARQSARPVDGRHPRLRHRSSSGSVRHRRRLALGSPPLKTTRSAVAK